MSSAYVSASHMVETVMINVEDFSGSFLTCGTCYSHYNSTEHSAKSLPCSHLICVSCIQRIIETQPNHSETFPCPHCREAISIPSNGPNSFPPAFIVNQLLDLLASQRRDLVPKCRYHPTQELLFCETCDEVFCADCRGHRNATDPCGGGITSLTSWDHNSDITAEGTSCVDHHRHFSGTDGKDSNSYSLDDGQISLHSSSLSSSSNSTTGGPLSHNVISFNVALKRCSEILLYKAHLCIQELNSAQEAVSAEIDRLDLNKDACVDAINCSFNQIIELVKHRRNDLLQVVRRISDEKRRSLTDQLQMIESERSKVRDRCEYLQDMVDVRSISKGITYLNDKLDTIASLTEPRENAYLRYQDRACGKTGFLKSYNIPTVNKTNYWRQPSLGSPHLPNGHQGAVSNFYSDSACVTPTKHHSLASGYPSSTPNNMDNSKQSHGNFAGSMTQADIACCLAAFGQIDISTTYPALCTLKMPTGELVVNLSDKAVIHTVDYHGQPQTSGTDPINIRFVHTSSNMAAPASLIDLADGSYQVILRPRHSGLHKLFVNILNRPMRGSPFQISVKSGQKPRWSAKDGYNNQCLVQPYSVTINWSPYVSRSFCNEMRPQSSFESNQNHSPQHLNHQITQADISALEIYLLDTGNSRLLVIDPFNGQVTRSIEGEPFQDRAATGMAWSPQGLWISNWRSKTIFLFDPHSEKILKRISSDQFQDPTSVHVCPKTGRVLVADNAAGCIFACEEKFSSTITTAESEISESNLETVTSHNHFRIWPLIGQPRSQSPWSSVEPQETTNSQTISRSTASLTSTVSAGVVENLSPTFGSKARKASSFAKTAAVGLRRSLMLGRGSTQTDKQTARVAKKVASIVHENAKISPEQKKSQNTIESMSTTAAPDVSSLEHGSCRKVNGLCISKDGEIILAAGSIIQIYSQNGKHIRDLYPPSAVPNVNETSFQFEPLSAGSVRVGRQVNSMIYPSSTSLQSSPLHQTNRNSVIVGSEYVSSLSMRNATLPACLIENQNFKNNVNLCGSSTHLRSTMSTISSGTTANRMASDERSVSIPKGHIGGVTIGSTSLEQPDSNLGDYLLASLTDRNKSVIVVWPEHIWKGTSPNSTVPNQQQSVYSSGTPIDAQDQTSSLDGSSTLTGPSSSGRQLMREWSAESSPLIKNETMPSIISNSQLSLCSTTIDPELSSANTDSVSTGESSINQEISRKIPEHKLADNQILQIDECNHLMQDCTKQPYVIEIEPGLRRSAGLICLPDSRDLVVVDLGGQMTHRIRYA